MDSTAWPSGAKPELAAAVAAAKAADVAILVLGEGEYMSGEAHSRAYLGLPGHQQSLMEAVHATGTPAVVVLMSGRPMVIPWMAKRIPAILQAWHGGIRAGRAVADILLGEVNPSGKLTASWPRTEGQIPVYYSHKNTGRPASEEPSSTGTSALKGQRWAWTARGSSRLWARTPAVVRATRSSSSTCATWWEVSPAR